MIAETSESEKVQNKMKYKKTNAHISLAYGG